MTVFSVLTTSRLTFCLRFPFLSPFTVGTLRPRVIDDIGNTHVCLLSNVDFYDDQNRPYNPCCFQRTPYRSSFAIRSALIPAGLCHRHQPHNEQDSTPRSIKKETSTMSSDLCPVYAPFFGAMVSPALGWLSQDLTGTDSALQTTFLAIDLLHLHETSPVTFTTSLCTRTSAPDRAAAPPSPSPVSEPLTVPPSLVSVSRPCRSSGRI